MKASKVAQEQLLALQALDSSLIQLAHKVKTLPVITTLEEKIAAHASARDLCIAAETEKSDIKHELSRVEVDVEQVVSRIDRDEKRLSAGQGTPKELEQLQHELASLAKRRSELEDVELEVMVRVEAVDQRIKELSRERDSLAVEIENLKQEKERAVAEIESAIKKTQQDRADLESKIEAELLALYEKIRANGDGIGAARLNGDRCEGCHLTMNAAEVVRVKALADDDVVRCEECRRILIRV
jgi:predicted  nucleic acid-binding Zn-ribbon protein